jgi:hypothetical protein
MSAGVRRCRPRLLLSWLLASGLAARLTPWVIGPGPDGPLLVTLRAALTAAPEDGCSFGHLRSCRDHRIRKQRCRRWRGCASLAPFGGGASLQVERFRCDPFRHAPGVTAVIAGSFILSRSPSNGHSLTLCSAQPAWRRSARARRAVPSIVRVSGLVPLDRLPRSRRAPDRAWPLAWPSPSGPENARRSGPGAFDLSPGDRRTWRVTIGPASSRSA